MTRIETVEEIKNILENIDGYSFECCSEYAFVLGYTTARLEELEKKIEGDY